MTHKHIWEVIYKTGEYYGAKCDDACGAYLSKKEVAEMLNAYDEEQILKGETDDSRDEENYFEGHDYEDHQERA